MAVLGGTPYSYSRYEMHLAALNGLAVYDESAAEFARTFGRRHDAVEAPNLRRGVRLRDAGLLCHQGPGGRGPTADVGLEDRPGAPPAAPALSGGALKEILAGRKGRRSSTRIFPWAKGECCSGNWLRPFTAYKKNRCDFIGGLGGRDISPEEFYEMAAVTRRAAETGQAPRRVSSIPKKSSAKSANSRLLLRSSAEDWENRHERHQI